MKKLIKFLINKILKGPCLNSETYTAFLKSKGMLLGEGCTFYDPKSNVIDISNPQLISMGNNVRIAHGVIILTHDYSWSVLCGVYGEALGGVAPVEIGNNIFIGMNAIILKGVKIGDNVIIGAGSVVTKDIPSNVVCAGNPAKIIMTLDEYYQKKKKQSISECQKLVNGVKSGTLNYSVLSEYKPLFMDYKEISVQILFKGTGYLDTCNLFYGRNERKFLDIDDCNLI